VSSVELLRQIENESRQPSGKPTSRSQAPLPYQTGERGICERVGVGLLPIYDRQPPDILAVAGSLWITSWA